MRWFYRGRHRWGPSDMSPVGQVWFHDGEWWTFRRLSAHRVLRQFDRRSNPLDHPLEQVTYVSVIGQRVEVGEVEYT